MVAAWCTVLAVVALGAAVRPRPGPRRFPRAESPQAARSLGVLRPRRHRSQPITAAEVAAWCEGLARIVRSGSTLGAALRATAPPPSCAPHVDAVVLALDRGSRLADALAGPTPSVHLDLAMTVLRACAVNGGPPAEPLDRAAMTLRSRAADAAERQTQSAQARLSALVMTILPVAMLALLLATSTSTRAAATSPIGASAIVAGGVLNLGGWRWMRRIIAGVSA